ncbi:cytochrome P450 [Hoeflea poritis]|uniref:Cytochrome P450 n=1 Tax=Hoeflea poritis TaxID=2993659 RepID=A0ABT4VMS2_9HYPH|nr:cytochrome P450 [Hoeflea poritis]MDA4845422.1 cytochrome P450 [Hoeflea poritis]
MASPVPVMDDISLAALTADPYPSFRRMREAASAVWVSDARINLVTRFEDIMTIERDHKRFASTNPGSLMNKVMGHSLMRKDDEDHQVERKAIEPSFRPGVVKNQWTPVFDGIAERLIDGFANGGETDLFGSFAAPMASLCLAEMIGFKDVSWQDLAAWSQALMDGVSNYGTEPDTAQRAAAASQAVNAAIDAVLDHHRNRPGPTILSSMLHAEHPHSVEQIRANIKVIIGGGLNEPRDSILTTVYGLLLNPDQRARVTADPKLYRTAFEEAVRWVSPIGMYPRRVTRDTVLGDTQLKQGDQLGICVGAANRDETRFSDPDAYDVFRDRHAHLGFGAGPHFCAGTWVARQMVGEIAVPKLFNRLTKLRLDEDRPAIMKGWVFRGPVSLPVRWEV